MSYIHTSVNEMSRTYLQNERRYNYTTPKSFLEQINLYSKLLRQKNDELMGKINRLETGLLTLKETEEQVMEDGQQRYWLSRRLIVGLGFERRPGDSRSGNGEEK